MLDFDRKENNKIVARNKQTCYTLYASLHNNTMCMSNETIPSRPAQYIPTLTVTIYNNVYYHSDRCHTSQIYTHDTYEDIHDKFELRNLNIFEH